MNPVVKAKQAASTTILLLILTGAALTGSAVVALMAAGPVPVAYADGCDSNPPDPSLDCPPTPTPTPTPPGH